MVAFMRYYHNKSIQLLFLGRVDIMMKFVVFLDIDGVLNTRTTVKRTPSDYTGIDDARVKILANAIEKCGGGEIILSSD